MPWIHVKYNYFSPRRRPSEILFQRTETCLKLFHRLIAAYESNTFIVAEIILELKQLIDTSLFQFQMRLHVK